MYSSTKKIFAKVQIEFEKTTPFGEYFIGPAPIKCEPNSVRYCLNPSKHIILGQEVGSLPIHDLHLRLLGGVDVELVEDHYLLVL